jgi:hypothetical protein
MLQQQLLAVLQVLQLVQVLQLLLLLEVQLLQVLLHLVERLRLLLRLLAPRGQWLHRQRALVHSHPLRCVRRPHHLQQ